MLKHFQGHSRPSITFTVSQVAWFTYSCKRLYEFALERIGQYLKGTTNKGLILRLTDSFGIYSFVDTDFARLWTHEDKLGPTCVKSRAGYVVCLAGCHIV